MKNVLLLLVLSLIAGPCWSSIVECSDEDLLERCLAGVPPTLVQPCKIWDYSLTCMKLAGCSEETIQISQEGFEMTYGFVCDENSDELTHDCANDDQLVRCYKRIDDTADVCTQWDDAVRCTKRAHCTPETVKVLEWSFKQFRNTTCPGMNSTIDNPCKNMDRLEECSKEIEATGDSCQLWRQTEDCMLSAGCARVYIDSAKRGLEVALNFTCYDEVTMENTGCRVLAGLKECIPETIYPEELCRNAESGITCMKKAQCRKGIIEVFERIFQEDKNITCEGMSQSTEPLCQDEDLLRKCMAGNFSNCQMMKRFGKCARLARCTEDYVALEHLRIFMDVDLRCFAESVRDCEDFDVLTKCFEEVDMAGDTCEQWDYAVQCMKKNSCTQETVKALEWSHKKLYNTTCQ